MKNTLILSCYDPVHESEIILNKIRTYNEEYLIPFSKMALIVAEKDLLYTIIRDTLDYTTISYFNSFGRFFIDTKEGKKLFTFLQFVRDKDPFYLLQFIISKNHPIRKDYIFSIYEQIKATTLADFMHGLTQISNANIYSHHEMSIMIEYTKKYIDILNLFKDKDTYHNFLSLFLSHYDDKDMTPRELLTNQLKTMISLETIGTRDEFFATFEESLKTLPINQEQKAGVSLVNFNSVNASQFKIIFIPGLNEEGVHAKITEDLLSLITHDELIKIITFSRFDIAGKGLTPFHGIQKGNGIIETEKKLFEEHNEISSQHSLNAIQKNFYEKLYKEKTVNEYLGLLKNIDIKDILKTKYDLIFSPTMLEDFSNCPYRFYLRYILGIDTHEKYIKEYYPPAHFIGTLTHEVLYKLYSLLKEKGLFPLNINKIEEYDGLLDEALSSSFAHHSHELLIKLPGIIFYVQTEIKTKVRSYLESEMKNEYFVPTYFEYPISTMNKNLIKIPLNKNETIFIKARIDRIDVDRKNGLLRIIDYKTGKQSMSESALSQGKYLQIPLYMYGVNQIFESSGLVCNQGDAHYLFHETGIKRMRFEFNEAFNKNALEDRIRNIYTKIIQGEFIPTPGKNRENCTFCNFNHTCRSDIDTIMERKKR